VLIKQDLIREHDKFMKNIIFILCVITSLNASSATLLERAAANGNIDNVKSLLSQGADVNAIDEDSTWEKTALFAAAEAGHNKVVSYLLSKGADVSLANAAETTPLRVAAYKGHAEVIQLLLEAGANPEEDTDYYQRSPFVWAILGAKNGNTVNYISVLKILREYGAKCHRTFIHPVDDSIVNLADSAIKSGQEIVNAFNMLCVPDDK
jgi:hypothetical protein